MDTTKYLWNDDKKRVEKLEIPEQSGFAKIHHDYLKKKRKERKKYGRKH